MSPVGLDPGAPNRWSFAAVEHAAVNGGSIGGSRHQAVKHVQLADEMTLAHSADRRIAAHLAGIFRAEAEESSTGACPSGSGHGLTTGMSGTDDDNVKHGVALAPDG
jgi:hypothetical protein